MPPAAQATREETTKSPWNWLVNWETDVTIPCILQQYTIPVFFLKRESENRPSIPGKVCGGAGSDPGLGKTASSVRRVPKFAYPLECPGELFLLKYLSE